VRLNEIRKEAATNKMTEDLKKRPTQEKRYTTEPDDNIVYVADDCDGQVQHQAPLSPPLTALQNSLFDMAAYQESLDAVEGEARNVSHADDLILDNEEYIVTSPEKRHNSILGLHAHPKASIHNDHIHGTRDSSGSIDGNLLQAMNSSPAPAFPTLVQH
jgi:hypothetical protein